MTDVEHRSVKAREAERSEAADDGLDTLQRGKQYLSRLFHTSGPANSDNVVPRREHRRHDSGVFPYIEDGVRIDPRRFAIYGPYPFGKGGLELGQEYDKSHSVGKLRSGKGQATSGNRATSYPDSASMYKSFRRAPTPNEAVRQFVRSAELTHEIQQLHLPRGSHSGYATPNPRELGATSRDTIGQRIKRKKVSMSRVPVLPDVQQDMHGLSLDFALQEPVKSDVLSIVLPEVSLQHAQDREQSHENASINNVPSLVISDDNTRSAAAPLLNDRLHVHPPGNPPTTETGDAGSSLSPASIVKVRSTANLSSFVDKQLELYSSIREHRVLQAHEKDVWASVEHLGKGSLGVVDEVRRKGTELPTIVRKRVALPIQKKKEEQIREIIRKEAATLRALRHPNIITLLGSYEDRTNTRCSSYCLLMAPVGERDLESFLIRVSDPDINLSQATQLRYRSWIQSWYTCLASALAYMHSNGVRHQDIKPSNIIHRQDHIFFTDFSSAGNFNVGHTTSTANPTRSTAMYAAPEALLPLCSADSRFGTALDVFGLGCVFCDMLTVETGSTVYEFCEFLTEGDTPAFGGGLRYSENLSRFPAFFQDKGDFYKDCISTMLAFDRKARPTAEAVHKYCLQTHRPLPR